MTRRTAGDAPTPARPAPAADLPPVPLDPELAAALEALGELPPLTPRDVPAVRAAVGAGALGDEALRCGGEVVWEEREVTGPAGAPDVTVLICRPAAAPAGSRLPLVYFMHGGGMIAGSRRHLMSDVLEWTRTLHTVTVSVEYRLAPEHPHPAPLEDCYAGLVWSARHAAELGADPDRIITVGTSAGGGLAAGLALLARDRGGPAPAAQMLLSPMLDDRNDTRSGRQMAGRDMWDRTSNATAWNAHLDGAAGAPDIPAHAAPARAADLTGLPPAYLDVGSAETFRDETVAYAGRLWQSGVPCELHVWPGGCHGFDEFVPRARLSRRAKEARREWLTSLLTAGRDGG
ncbi:alpha/beta hydrolase [Streptomyces glaucescens]|uniref:Alpha/beta hydrolase n=1 Tax=Streptomyces glaucescens TaxID=1907 RepID=A0A089X0A8_STRGA|nr:alpha/beta hydrolase fold domain-containing protein [Streptomyces glaucescens]AIR96418.1 alpha/beta hydrolase [Streptomyces glaucescens]